MAAMWTLEEARAAILAALRPLGGAEVVALSEAGGRRLACEVVAPCDAPRFDNSAMDGYALRWSELREGQRAFVVSQDLSAGAAPAPLEPHTAARVMTGARLPEGADTVVMREDTDERDPRRVEVLGLPKQQGAHVRPRGSVLRAGQRALEAGALLRGGDVGLLASLGKASVQVRRRPVVAIVPTGDELVEVGEPVGEAQLVNSSAWMLAQLVREASGAPRVSPIARDTLEDTRARVVEALEGADLLLTMGGVSVGDRDVIKEVMGQLCGQVELWRVRVKPGKPLAFARTPTGAAWLGLPGNPVSSYVAFWAFVWPALRRLQGATPETLPTVEAVVEADVRSTPERLELVRGALRWEAGAWRFWPFAGQGSDDLTSARACTGLLHVPVGCARLERGAVGLVEALPAAP